jgi:hypothetical protein
MLTDQNSMHPLRTGPGDSDSAAESLAHRAPFLERSDEKDFIAVRILDRVLSTKLLVRWDRCESFPRLASEWDFQLRVASLTPYAPAPNLMA